MFFTDYHEASAYARERVKASGFAYGIEKCAEYGRNGYRVKMLPRRANRYGWETRCEAIEPGEVQS